MKPHSVGLLLSIFANKLTGSLCNLGRETVQRHRTILDRHDPPLPVVILSPISSPPLSKPSNRPTYRRKKPTSWPTFRRNKKSNRPTRRPSYRRKKTNLPSTKPEIGATTQPSLKPSKKPSIKPSIMATPPSRESTRPSVAPNQRLPTMKPTAKITFDRTSHPVASLTSKPSSQPTLEPSTQLTSAKPSSKPTVQSSKLTMGPIARSTATPSSTSTKKPIARSTMTPTAEPTVIPSSAPLTGVPTVLSSAQPTTMNPTSNTAVIISSIPSAKLTGVPSVQLSAQPTAILKSTTTMNPTSKTTVIPSSTPSAKLTGQPSLPVQLSAHPTTYPTSMTTVNPASTNMVNTTNTNCTLSSAGNYGVVSDLLPSISLDYKYELLTNSTLQIKLNSSAANAVLDVEIAITNLLVKVLFSACVPTRDHRRQPMLRALSETPVSGISTAPADVVSSDSCTSLNIQDGTQCVVVNGRLTLYVSSTSVSSSLMQTTLNAIAGGMNSGELATANDMIIILRYIDPTTKIIATSPLVSSPTSENAQREWPIILGASIGAGMVLMIIAAATRRKKKSIYKREDFIQVDPSISDLGDEENGHCSARVVQLEQPNVCADGYSIHGRDLFSVAEELSNLLNRNYSDHIDSVETTKSDEANESITPTLAGSKGADSVNGYSIEGRDLFSVAEELSNFISNNYIDSVGSAVSDSDVFDHLPDGMESDEIDDSSTNTVRINNVHSDDSASTDGYVSTEEEKPKITVAKSDGVAAAADKYCIEGRNLFTITQEQELSSNVAKETFIDSASIAVTDSDSFDIAILSDEASETFSTLAESTAIEPTDDYSIMGRDLKSVAEELSNVISKNYPHSVDNSDTGGDSSDQIPHQELDETSAKCVESNCGSLIGGQNVLFVAEELTNVIYANDVDKTMDSAGTGRVAIDNLSDDDKFGTKAALAESKAINSVNGYAIEGQNLLCVAEELSNVINSNYIHAVVSESTSSDSLDNLSNEDEPNENLITNVSVLADDSCFSFREPADEQISDSLKNNDPICTICRKSLEGKSKKLCQCGRSDCNLSAHVICALDKYPLPSVSHPGTPPPAKFLLCRDKYILSSIQSPTLPR